MDLLINVDVDDLGKAEAFYTACFDLRVGRRFGAAGLELLGAPAPIYLLRKSEGSRATPKATDTRRFARHWTPVHLDFVTSDIERAVALAQSLGAGLEQPVSTTAWGSLALLADPFGNGFCFVQFSQAGYDAIADC